MTITKDPPTTTAAAPPPENPGQRRELQPLLASWLKDRSEFTEKVTDVSKRAAHTTAWHTLHSPLHALRILRYAPVGAWRAVKAVWAWVWDHEGKPLRQNAVHHKDSPEWRALVKEREKRIHRRWIGLTVMTVLILLGLILTWFLLPSWEITPWFELTRGWVFSIATAAAIAGFSYLGRPPDRPLLAHAADVSGNPPLKPETVINALINLRIPGMTRPEDIRILFDVPSPSSGYLFELELPAGVTAEAVMEKRSELSAALRHPVGTVWPAVGKRHQGHLVLFVSHENMNTMKQKPWPLLRSGVVDVFNPQPMFTDQRNRWITQVLAYTSGVIGALPRMGKTFILRQLLLIASLDPRCKIYAFDLKGTGDLSPLKLVAHRYACDSRPDKIAGLLPIARELREEMHRRADKVSDLPYEVCPENKVTSELASRRDLGLEPIFVGVDECHELFEHEDKAVADEFIRIFTDLVKRGPALGIMVYLATQKPSAKSIPTGISDNAVIRICLKVHGQTSNDQVLGTSAHKMGIKATMLAFEDKGVAYLKGEGSDAKIVRGVVGLDTPTAEKVALRARAARELEGRLTGHAIGEEMEREVEEVVLLDDVRRVFGAELAMHLTDIVTGLAGLRPGAWGSLTADSLGSQLRTAGVKTGTVHAKGKPRGKASGKGVKREWLDVSTTLLSGNEDPGEDAE